MFVSGVEDESAMSGTSTSARVHLRFKFLMLRV